MKVLHVGASDIGGGAARAAYRVHRSLVDHASELGVDSRLRVIQKLTNDYTVLGGPPAGQGSIWKRLHPRLNRRAKRGFTTGNPVLHSIAWPNTGLGRELEELRNKDVDLLHLHWLGDSTLSIEEIGRLPQPIVWRLADQWAFCGAEHYVSPHLNAETDGSYERYALGYSSSSRPFHEKGQDLNRRTWLRKHRAWQKPMHIVCPSEWLANCVRASTLMHHWPISVIPSAIDLDTWTPINKAYARSVLKIPNDCRLILFGAVNALSDSRKGCDLLLQALTRLNDPGFAIHEEYQLMIFGGDDKQLLPCSDYMIHLFGAVRDDLCLKILYSAADVFVIPSRQDNLPGTGIEAMACGTPIVAFRTGGLGEIVADRITGALAEPFDPDSLAGCIRWVLEDSQRCQQLAAASRLRAEQLYNPRRVAGLYVDLYRQVLGK